MEISDLKQGEGFLRTEWGPFRRLLGAECASLIGDFALIPIIPFAVYGLGGSTAEVAGVLGAGFLSKTMLVLFGGVAGDRLERRAVMIAADLLRFGAQLMVAVLFLSGEASVWQLAVAQFVVGIGDAFFNPALTGMVQQTVDSPDRQAANGKRGVAEAVASMIGPAIGGAIVALANPGWAFGATALTFLASAVLLTTLRTSTAAEEETESNESPSLLADLAEGWKEFRRRTWLWAIVLGFGVVNALVVAPFFVLGPRLVSGAGAWSTLLVAVGIGGAAGGILVTRWRHPDRPLLVASLSVALWIPVTILLAVGAPPVAVALAGALGGAGFSVFTALWQTAIQGLPAGQLSRMSSYEWFGSLGMLPLGYAAAAVAASTIGAEAGLLAGAMILLLTTSSWVALSSIRHYRSPAAPEPQPNLATVTATSGQR